VRDRLGRYERYFWQAATAMWRDVALWPETDIPIALMDVCFQG
jgi:hypothetical protein